MENIFSSKFIAATKEMSDLHKCVPAPYMRKSFELNKAVKKAEITICGLGFYRFWLNGEELTRGLLSPYITNPDNILDYDRYDLSELLKKGKNVLAFELGNGMQNSFGGYVWDFEKASFRSAPKMAMCMQAELEDGSVLTIEADENFKTHPSPLIRDELRLGEIYDANCEIDGWQSIDFDDSVWKNAIIAKTPAGTPVICCAKPITERCEIKPINVSFGKWRPSSTRMHHYGYIYDFGINTAGITELRIKGKKGQKITLTYGEILVNGDFSTDNVSFIRPNLEAYPDYIQQIVYICKGENEEIFKPSFTYHGFRYVFVEGIEKEQATNDLLTYKVMNTELSEKGAFSSSCDKLNCLQDMTRNATLSNFWHFPNDCPHREKNGWTADAALSAEHTLLNLDPYDNYREWMRHICAALNEEGALPGIVPTSGWGFAWGNGPSWDQVLVELPLMSYRYTGNMEIVKDSMDSIMRYVKYLETRKDDKGLLAIGLGDWLASSYINGGQSVTIKIKSPLIFTDSVMAMSICEKAALLSKLCGREEDRLYCKSAADALRLAIRTHLIDTDTGIAAGECQTSQAMIIYYNLVEGEEKKKALDALISYIEKENNHFDTGVVGGRVIFHVLSEAGYADLAYEVITNPTPPSYAYWINRGYTSLAEHFKTVDMGIASLNHHFWGDISAWFIKSIAGINYNPGFNDHAYLEIKPHFISTFDNAKAHFDSPKGRIESSWRRDRDNVVLDLVIPDGMKSNISLSNGYKVISESTNGNKKTLVCTK